MTVISELKRESGFFSTFFFTMNHFIYCKKNEITFKLQSNEWFYKSEKGWEDYFVPVDLQFSDTNNEETIIASHGKVLCKYPIYEYKNILFDIYTYNQRTKDKIHETKTRLGLSEYGSIFIRRGEKLIFESKLYETHKYIEMLLDKYPTCKHVFLQTDDYNCFIELQDYIKDKKLDIKVSTLCHEDMRGVYLSDNLVNQGTNISRNQHYIQKIHREPRQTLAVANMNPTQIYDHTMDMIVGLDIVFNSEYCITDYQSNVSRFIKLAHKNFDNVFDMDGFELDLNCEICPSYPESVYTNPDNWRHT